jgi:hypothetical protein
MEMLNQLFILFLREKNRKATNKDLSNLNFQNLILGEGFLTNSYFAVGITEKNLWKIYLGIVTKHTSVRQTNSVCL